MITEDLSSQITRLLQLIEAQYQVACAWETATAKTLGRVPRGEKIDDLERQLREMRRHREVENRELLDTDKATV